MKCQKCGKQTSKIYTVKVVPPMVEVILGIAKVETLKVCEGCSK